MKVCAVCHQILVVGQNCDRAECPNLTSLVADGLTKKIHPGFTGKADQMIQRGQDGAALLIRNLLRRALVGLIFLATVAVLTLLILFLGSETEDFSLAGEAGSNATAKLPSESTLAEDAPQAGPISVTDNGIIRCEKVGAEAITVTIGAEEQLGATLNCVDGGFTTEIGSCAPEGGYGLYGRLGLAHIVWRWQDYGNHMGGVVGHSITPTNIYFSGGYYSGAQNWSGQWSLDIDRVTGVGKLRLGRPSSTQSEEYACKAVNTKF